MDVKAGGGQVMKLGMILRQWLVKLEWFSTLFPRIPVPIQQRIQKVLEVKTIIMFLTFQKIKNKYLEISLFSGELC